MKTADATVISVNGTSTAEELFELDKISDEDLKVIKAFGKPIIPKLEKLCDVSLFTLSPN